jgi:NAD(P)-dependent dehydrogenase (short-subunit alcohol dehydrogenase family)
MKTVLITGASSGIGAGLAKSFAADGYHVIACGRDPARLEALHQTCPNLTVRLFDMTDRDACRQALTGSYADLIILCAGTCEYLDGGVVDAALVERVMNTNFLGPVNCLDALQPQLGWQPRGAGEFDGPLAAFPTGRGLRRVQSGAELVCRKPAPGLGAKGIAVTVVSPGFVDTPLTRKNDFAMPGRVSVDEAVKAIRTGLAAGKMHIAFPAGFGFILRLLSGLPAFLQRALLRRMVRS